MADFFRSASLHTTTADAVVVVHCSDPRYQPHFQDFIRRGLRVERYALVAIPGGAQTLTLVDYLPKFAWSGWRWIKFLATLTAPSRVILLTHDDCRWYLENRFADEGSARTRQIDDLRRVRHALIERFGPIQVDLFFATLRGDHAVFEVV